MVGSGLAVGVRRDVLEVPRPEAGDPRKRVSRRVRAPSRIHGSRISSRGRRAGALRTGDWSSSPRTSDPCRPRNP